MKKKQGQHNKKTKKINHQIHNQQQLIATKRQLEQTELSEDESVDREDELVKVKIGKVPYGWYQDFKHFGYDNKLNAVPKQKQTDKIEQFIMKSENKDWWRTIRDQLNGRDIILSDQQLQLIDRIRSGKMASKTIATSTYQITHDNNDPFPLHAHPPSKRNFMPSKWQQMKVNKILDGLLSGRIKWNNEEQNQQEEKLYDAWATGNISQRGVINIGPMKQKLPDNSESYNPPKEYLLNQDELKQWKEMDEEDRPYNYIPSQYSKMRHIPFYDRLINERFQRCLDLYLCPRVKKKKLNIDPDTLIPKLPDPSTMKPFPVALNINYQGHNATVKSLATSPQGDYLASGDQSGVIIIWDTMTSRILYTRQFSNESINTISWSKNNIIAFSHGQTLELLIWKYPNQMRELAETIIESIQGKAESNWYFYAKDHQLYGEGYRIKITMQNQITHLEFHVKGDYFLTVCPYNQKKNEVVIVHQLSKAVSQKPFEKAKGSIRKAYFHPRKPCLILLTQVKIFIYNLQKQSMVKKLVQTSNNNCCLSVHPYGDHLIVGSQDRKVTWYDLDLGEKPYKTMEYHQKAINDTQFHKEYPLMATCSDDGTIQIFHAKVSAQDILSDAIILPLKVLRGHSSKEGVTKICFHPKQPWIFSCGQDHKVFLWT